MPATSRKPTQVAPPPEPGSVFSVLERVERHQGVLVASDLVEILGLHRDTIYDMMARDIIPTIQDGCAKKRVDPKTYAYVLRTKDRMMREAARKG